MTISSSERFERTQEMVTQASEVLGELDTSLLGRNIPFGSMLETAEILEVSSSGRLSKPETENIAIVGMRSKLNETIFLPPALAAPTHDQRSKILDAVSAWQPTEQSVDSLMDEYYDTALLGTSFPFKIQPDMGAATVSMSRLLPVSKLHLANSPRGRVAQLFFRPILAIAIDDDPGHETEMLGHELTHVDQRLNNPVRLHDNQTQTNREILRNELEAYHIGALALLHLAGIDSITKITPALETASQATIESARHKVNRNIRDPFLVTPDLEKELSKRLTRLGRSIEDLIHGPIKVEEAVKAAEIQYQQNKRS